MPEIVNLRLARKTRDRRRKQAEAEQNRALFGRPKAERVLTEAERAKAERELDGRRLATPEDPSPKESAPPRRFPSDEP